MPSTPQIDADAPLLFVVNTAAGHADAEARRALIADTLGAAGRRFDVLCCPAAATARVAAEATQRALATRSAVVAVGGDGTINTVAQAAHAAGCAMGVLAQGTFNYFARRHGIPADMADATRLLLRAVPTPVQVAAINERVFLVNASLGLYPDLLEDREAYKARFGRSRVVAFGAGLVTLLRAQRRLHLQVQSGGTVRKMRTLTLFVGNNRLQLAQLGVLPPAGAAPALPQGSVAAVILKPIGTLSMLGLMLRGALGTLGEADSIERFAFTQLRVTPALAQGRRGVKVAFDGEVAWMRAPLEFRVLERPLYLMKEQAAEPTVDAAAAVA